MPSNITPGGVANDQQLMQAIASGDAASLGALYDRHSGLVLAVCLRILGNRVEAEEALGDVFWQVWEQAVRYDPLRGNPVAWILTLARSRALDRMRAAGRRRKVIVESDATAGSGDSRDSGPSPEPRDFATRDPFQDAELAQQRERIHTAMSGLDDAQRRAVELSFFEGLSHSEIADHLGEPLGTVKTRIRQGLIHLREALRSQYGKGATA